MKINLVTHNRWKPAFLLVACFLFPFIQSEVSYAKDIEIKIIDTEFKPKTLKVKAGSQVVWKNKEGSHTIEADDGSFKSPVLSDGEVFKQKFEKKGKFPYHCQFHGGAHGVGMSGTIVVE